MKIKRIETFGLKENDIVIIRVNDRIPDDLKKKFEKTWSDVFEHQGYKNIKVIALGESVGIEIISKQG